MIKYDQKQVSQLNDIIIKLQYFWQFLAKFLFIFRNVPKLKKFWVHFSKMGTYAANGVGTGFIQGQLS